MTGVCSSFAEVYGDSALSCARDTLVSHSIVVSWQLWFRFSDHCSIVILFST